MTPNTKTNAHSLVLAWGASDRRASGSPRLGSGALIACLLAVFAATLLLSMRLSPDTVRGARFIRSLLARTLLFSCVSTAFSLGAAALLRRLHHSVDFTRAALGGAATGVILHLALMIGVAGSMDARLQRRIQEVNQQAGVITFHLSNQESISIKPEGARWMRMDPVVQVPAMTKQLLCAAEDERCMDRLVCVDIEAYLRVAVGSLRKAVSGQHGRLAGASDLSAQVAMLLEDDLKPRGHGLDMFTTKLRKTLAGCRIDDLMSRDEQIQLYLALAPFGTVHGHEVVGIASAAQVYYNRNPAELSVAQTAELMARLRNPQYYYPYPRAAESPEAYEARLARLRDRTFAILDVARRRGHLSQPGYEQARGEFLSGLTPSGALAGQALLPHAPTLIRAVLDRVPDAAERHLEAWSADDSRLQGMLASAASRTLDELRPRLQEGRYPDDAVLVDAIVLNRDGDVVAQIGLPTASGGMASQIKPENYALWLSQDPRRNMNQIVGATRMTAAQGLSQSNNQVAMAVANQTGLDRLVEHLRSQGYHVIGPFEPIVLGAGVTGSPWLVAGNLYKFGYAQPGYRITPSVLSRVADARTGAVLFEPERSAVFSPAVARQVRSAMEQVSLEGTAHKALHALAVASPIAAKTGTAGFYRNGQWLGDGGSWCTAVDSATGMTVVVRIRWSSGHPFELEGGQSAAYIVSKFFVASRVLMTGDTNE